MLVRKPLAIAIAATLLGGEVRSYGFIIAGVAIGAVIGSVVVVTVVYCVVEFCVVGLRRYDDPSMASETVLMEIARSLMGQAGYGLILLGGILATVSSANASIMAASRISFGTVNEVSADSLVIS